MKLPPRFSFLIFSIIGISLFVLILGNNTLFANNNELTTGESAESVTIKSSYINNSHYKSSLKKLDKLTPLDLRFNPIVQNHIERFLNGRKNDIAIFLGRSKFYFPIIEESLDRYDLPLELKYLVVIESGLNPRARSKSGAMGLWQFLYNTGKLFDLEVSSYIDERCDPVKSSDAACRYISYLYQTFKDWNLVLAAYNGGPGEVRKAIERSGGQTDFWAIRPYLSQQASNYVPAFIAMNYIFETYPKHSIDPIPFKFTYQEIDSIHLNYPLSFVQISKVINLRHEDLVLLNPVYRKDYIPVSDREYVLFLPKSKVKSFILYENEIKTQEVKEPDYLDLLKTAGETANRDKVIHKVQSGEYYHMIALKYNCTIENIKAWNHIEDSPLFQGQKLVLWVIQ